MTTGIIELKKHGIQKPVFDENNKILRHFGSPNQKRNNFLIRSITWQFINRNHCK